MELKRPLHADVHVILSAPVAHTYLKIGPLSLLILTPFLHAFRSVCDNSATSYRVIALHLSAFCRPPAVGRKDMTCHHCRIVRTQPCNGFCLFRRMDGSHDRLFFDRHVDDHLAHFHTGFVVCFGGSHARRDTVHPHAPICLADRGKLRQPNDARLGRCIGCSGWPHIWHPG